MKKYNIGALALTLSMLPTLSMALVCPDINSAPKCPTSGIKLLDETYPTQTFVISNLPMLETKESKNVPRNFIEKIIKNYDYKDVPQIVLPLTSKEEFDLIVLNVKERLKKKDLSEKEIAAITDQITFMPNKNYTWQQDWFESFVDLKTGSPVVRPIESYYVRMTPGSSRQLSNAASTCGVKDGDSLKTSYSSTATTMEEVKRSQRSYGSGEMGGNIEGAPGGFCMIGDNMGKEISADICGDESNIIRLQTSFLSVGHVDEIFKVIPTNFNDGRPRECEFSIMSASPKKALALMGSPQATNIPFIDVDMNNEDIDTKEFRGTRSDARFPGNYIMCNYIKEAITKRGPNAPKLSPRSKNVFFRLFGVTDLYAQLSAVADEKCAENLDQISNAELKEIMVQDVDTMLVNQAIQNSIEADRKIIKNKILSRLPQCEKYYNEIEAPNLFYGTAPILNAQGQLELIRPGRIDSFLPNPTNSVLMNKTLTLPNSGNNLFNDYVVDELKKVKMKADFIESWDYAHLGNGNIHCSSHSLPYCKP